MLTLGDKMLSYSYARDVYKILKANIVLHLGKSHCMVDLMFE